MKEELLKGKVALITGGTAGIGKAIVHRFAEEGARVAIVGTNQQRGKAIVEEIVERFPESQAIFFPVNVSDAESVKEGTKKVLEAFGHVDILVNNAGITKDQLLIRMPEKDWDDVIDTNLKSCFLMIQALLKPMMKARQGKIINMSSIVGITGNAGQGNYAASKAGIIGLTKAMAKELASRNIAVNCIAPGFIDTPMTQALTEEQRSKILTSVPVGRLGTPEEIANVALFLASALSDYVTGQVLIVDGGMALGG